MEKKTPEEVLKDWTKHVPLLDVNIPPSICINAMHEYATQATTHLQERIDELEGTILAAKQLFEAEYIGEALDLLETKSNALNPHQ